MLWTEKDIESGVIVSKRRSQLNLNYQIPAIITRVPGSNPGLGWGLCDLNDGLLMGFANKGSFGSKIELAASLTEMGYIPVPKMVFSRGIETLPENRLEQPMLAITYSN